MNRINKINLWIVDDDNIDRELLIEAMDESSIHYEAMEFSNGLDALNHLKKTDTHQFPDFILLDLNMPLLDGRETLKFIKNSEQYKIIPVFICTTSNSAQDVHYSYFTGANLFFTKPSDFKELRNCINNLFSLFQTNVVRV